MTKKAPAAGGLNLAAFLPYRIAVLARTLSERLGAAYADEGLTIPEWRVLAVVSQENAVAARDVVARTPMDKMAVSRAVASLEKKGLVARQPASDRRVSAIRLSDEGRRIADRVAGIALRFEADIVGGMTGTERDLFLESLAKLEAAAGLDCSSQSAVKAAE
ncbi:MAG TPA: MarR family transcriptional regulator [Parvularculaceae bacterium]|nr:MarR family transcriptional regulator [Parvularculaceae bacterium]HNS85289.1 MarR family transcriptional regulator [Parvularculaceae bacterium]